MYDNMADIYTDRHINTDRIYRLTRRVAYLLRYPKESPAAIPTMAPTITSPR